MSIATCLVTVKTGSDELVGQIFGLVGVVCCIVAYRRTVHTSRIARDQSHDVHRVAQECEEREHAEDPRR